MADHPLDVRWKQRLSSYSKAYALLKDAFLDETRELTALETEGVIHRFEFTYELAWNLLGDYLQASGIQLVRSPREVIKRSAAAGLIDQGQLWIDMHLVRNAVAHQYDETKARQALNEIKTQFLPLFEALHRQFTDRLSTE